MDSIADILVVEPALIAPGLRDAMRDAHLVPLWESPTAHKLDVEREAAHIWPWDVMRPVLNDVAAVSSPKVVERRVLSLVNPRSRSAEDEATTGAISAALQMLLPGERARPHRHSMNALRFVVDGIGAATIVDGKSSEMAPGDLIITPAWCWHEHVSNGPEPTIWVDVLDVALHLFLGTDEFQPGPVRDAAAVLDDQAFATANILPSIEHRTTSYSPVFRYPRQDAFKALASAPVGADGMRRVRYVNPLTGGSAMSTLDCEMVQLERGRQTRTFKTTASAVCVVAEGEGESVIGAKTIGWRKNDVFTLPFGAWSHHRAATDAARIFMVSNREVYAKLGLLKEEYRS